MNVYEIFSCREVFYVQASSYPVAIQRGVKAINRSRRDKKYLSIEKFAQIEVKASLLEKNVTLDEYLERAK